MLDICQRSKTCALVPTFSQVTPLYLSKFEMNSFVEMTPLAMENTFICNVPRCWEAHLVLLTIYSLDVI